MKALNDLAALAAGSMESQLQQQAREHIEKALLEVKEMPVVLTVVARDATGNRRVTRVNTRAAFEIVEGTTRITAVVRLEEILNQYIMEAPEHSE